DSNTEVVMRQRQRHRQSVQSQHNNVESASQVMTARLDRQADMLDAQDPKLGRAHHDTGGRSKGGAAVDDRISRWTGSITVSVVGSPPPSRSSSCATAQRPIDPVAWATVVSGGSAYAARSTSSKPTTLTSS